MFVPCSIFTEFDNPSPADIEVISYKVDNMGWPCK